MVSKWEAGGTAIRPREVNQAASDESLGRCSPFERARFERALRGMPDEVRPGLRWCLVVDLPAGDRRLADAIADAIAAAVNAVVAEEA
jgi:hypothetical protein